jgi:hypothetical protein
MKTTTLIPSNALVPVAPQPGSSLGFPSTGTGLAVIDQINKADIVAIVRNEAEEALLAQQNDVSRRLSALSQKIAVLQGRIDESAQAAIGKVDTTAAERAADALKAFGLKCEIKVELAGRDDEHRRFNLTINLNRTDAESYNQEIVTREVTVAYSSADLEALKEIKTLQKNVIEVQAELLALKRDLGNLPALERKAHATLARHVLNQSAEGQKLLAKLRPVKPVVAID